MKYFSILFFSLVLAACGSTKEPKEKVIISTWPNGNPKVEHIQLKGDTVKVFNLDQDGRIKTEGKMHGETREGKWYTYYPNGFKWSLNSFQAGEKHGEYKTWYPNGELNISGHFSLGSSTGKWEFFDSTGVLTKEFDVTPQN